MRRSVPPCLGKTPPCIRFFAVTTRDESGRKFREIVLVHPGEEQEGYSILVRGLQPGSQSRKENPVAEFHCQQDSCASTMLCGVRACRAWRPARGGGRSRLSASVISPARAGPDMTSAASALEESSGFL